MKFTRPQTAFLPNRPKRRFLKFFCLGLVIVSLLIFYLAYYYYYYASYWLLLRPLYYGFFQKIYCSTLVDCQQKNLLNRNGNDYIFCSMMPLIGKRFYARFFEKSEGHRKAIALISHWDHVVNPNLGTCILFKFFFYSQLIIYDVVLDINWKLFLKSELHLFVDCFYFYS